jgi:hypothetical protein
MLAEEAYLAANPLPPTLPEGATETVERTFVSKEDDFTLARALAAFGDCIVFRDTSKADTLLRTMPGSAAERSAAVALAPILGACLDEGSTISLTAASIRSFVADGLWNRFTRPHRLEKAAEQG